MGETLFLKSAREKRKAERRARIMSIAGPMFLELGYSGTTMSAIAVALGGSKATLWSYFSSKEDLFAACVETAIRSFREDLVATLDPLTDVRQAVSTFAARYIEGLCDPEAIALQRLITSEGTQFPALSAIFYSQGPRATAELLETYILDQMERRVLRSDDPRVAANMIVGLCVSGLRQKVLWGVAAYSASEATEEAVIIVDLFLRCYDNPKSSEVLTAVGRN